MSDAPVRVVAEAGTPVRAHQAGSAGARQLRGQGRGDRGSDRQQGARTSRRSARGKSGLDRRHLVQPSRRSPVAPGLPGSDLSSAVRGGAAEGGPWSVADDEGTAPPGGGGLTGPAPLAT